jgi:hypothetical protein
MKTKLIKDVKTNVRFWKLYAKWLSKMKFKCVLLMKINKLVENKIFLKMNV